MKKPIIFNTDMVRAILDGRKTVTRRVINPQPRKKEERPHCIRSGNWFFDVPSLHFPGTIDASVGPYCPPCQPGDILYVRETWRKDVGRYMYKANYAENEKFYRGGKEVQIKWRPSVYMPEEIARIFLQVTDVRVERLQDMCLIDYLKEGVRLTTVDQSNLVLQEMRFRERFSGVWDSAIKPADRETYGWDANPWVWAIDFERIDKNNAIS